jgi:23S rRNA (guanosine2251-2'-O)-methyltransferase
MSSFPFVECADLVCRLRFPLLPPAQAAVCPRCGSPLQPRPEPVEGPLSEHAKGPASEHAEGPPLVALLDSIRSVYNVGSMFRTADGAGFSQLYLAGITATPEHPKVVKTALGAEQAVAWSYHRHGPTAAAELQTAGYQLLALERSAHSQPLAAVSLNLTRPVALMVGNEICGIDPAILALADYVAHLPMYGRKQSLNVVVAFGVAAYWLRQQVQHVG